MQSAKQPNGRKSRMLLSIFAGHWILSLLFAGPLQAEEKSILSFSLRQAREYAVQHSFEVKKSRLDVASAQKKLRETVASGLPQVSTSINYINNLELATILIPNFFEGKFDEKIAVQFGTQHSANLSFQVDQLIFNGSYIVGLKTSGIYRKLAEQGLEQTELNIQETVTGTYYLILVARESERILGESLKNLEKTQYEIQERHKEGFVAETDVDLIQIAVTKLRNALQNLNRQQEIALKLLKFQIGLDMETMIELTDGLEGIMGDVDIQQSLERAFTLGDSIDFNLLKTQEKLAEMSMRNEKAKYWPTVSAFYTYQRSAMRDTFNFFNFKEDWFRAQFFGINIMIPIFKSGAQRARVQQAAIAWEQVKNTREQAGRGLQLEFDRARIELKSAHENYLNVKANMVLAEKVYNVTLTKYKEGVSSSMEAAQAHDAFLATQSEYIQAVAGLLNAKNKLDRMTEQYSAAEKGQGS